MPKRQPYKPTLRDTSAAAWRRLVRLRRKLTAAPVAALPLTLFACLFGGLLALPWTPAEAWRLALVTLALLCAHGACMLLNQWIDGRAARPPAPNPGSALVRVALLIATAFAALVLTAAIARAAGPPVWWLTGAGLLLLVGYLWPNNRMALGEVAAFLGWGPLMVGGVYWVVSSDWGPDILLVSALFGLGPVVAVLGRHADKPPRHAARRPVRRPGAMAVVALLQMAAGLGWAWVAERWAFFLLLSALPALIMLVGTAVRRGPTARPQRYPAALWRQRHQAAGLRYARASGAALVAAALIDGL